MLSVFLSIFSYKFWSKYVKKFKVIIIPCVCRQLRSERWRTSQFRSNSLLFLIARVKMGNLHKFTKRLKKEMD